MQSAETRQPNFTHRFTIVHTEGLGPEQVTLPQNPQNTTLQLPLCHVYIVKENSYDTLFCPLNRQQEWMWLNSVVRKYKGDTSPASTVVCASIFTVLYSSMNGFRTENSALLQRSSNLAYIACLSLLFPSFVDLGDD